jgi:predicted HTH domain antitoxin
LMGAGEECGSCTMNPRIALEMKMATTLRIELPPSLSEGEARLLFAVKLFEIGKVSLGQAAKIAELSKRAFMEMLGRYGVPVFNYSAEELRHEVDS